ncbi:MAG TPA: hypothetical protein VGO86_08555 [Candidatus Dormibacteraeota bacterium]
MVHAIDDLLFQLEDLNLQGVDRVPATLRERAGQILDAVPTREEYESLRVRYRVVPMMDVLFRAQEVLFRLRDPRRATYEDEDAAEERAAEAAAACVATVTPAVEAVTPAPPLTPEALPEPALAGAVAASTADAND